MTMYVQLYQGLIAKGPLLNSSKNIFAFTNQATIVAIPLLLFLEIM